MIITITGTPGSGKSTLAKRLAETLGYPHHNIGGMRREIARRHGLTLEELNKLGEREDWTDREVDDYIRELGRQGADCIIEGRTAFFLVPQSLKVFVKVDPEVGAGRVFHELQADAATRNEGQGLNSIQDVRASHERRIQSDTFRYQKYYGVNVYDRSAYDLVLDTSTLTPEQSFQALYRFIQSHPGGRSSRA